MQDTAYTNFRLKHPVSWSFLILILSVHFDTFSSFVATPHDALLFKLNLNFICILSDWCAHRTGYTILICIAILYYWIESRDRFICELNSCTQNMIFLNFLDGPIESQKQPFELKMSRSVSHIEDYQMENYDGHVFYAALYA